LQPHNKSTVEDIERHNFFPVIPACPESLLLCGKMMPDKPE
jgi:hypothetical protein